MDVHDLIARERRETLVEVAEDLARLEVKYHNEVYAIAYKRAKEMVLNKIVEGIAKQPVEPSR